MTTTPRPTRKTAAPQPPEEDAPHTYGDGRRKLLAAAARLAARHGHKGFSLRDLAREAGLGHNTIYRHFESVEAMMPILVDEFYRDLRAGLSEARRRVPAGVSPSRTVVSWLLDFAEAHRDTFLVSMRERYGPTDDASAATERALQDIQADMLRELPRLGHLPNPVSDHMSVAVRMLIEQSFQFCMEYIRHPERRDDILDRAELGYRWLIGGATSAK